MKKGVLVEAVMLALLLLGCSNNNSGMKVSSVYENIEVLFKLDALQDALIETESSELEEAIGHERDLIIRMCIGKVGQREAEYSSATSLLFYAIRRNVADEFRIRALLQPHYCDTCSVIDAQGILLQKELDRAGILSEFEILILFQGMQKGVYFSENIAKAFSELETSVNALRADRQIWINPQPRTK